MGRLHVGAALAAVALLVLAAPGAAQEEPKAVDKQAADPKTETVTKGPFAVVLELSGTFDARQSTEVLFLPEQWGADLEVLEMATPGPVEKGAVLVKFDPEKIDEALAAADRDLATAKINLRRQTEEAARQEEAQAVAVKRAEIDAQNAETALRRWMEWDKELRLKEADQRLQQTRDNIADQEEELRQLEKMYKADELTEETEDIVLMRAKRQLARSQFWLTSQLKRDEVWRAEDVPRDQENLENTKRRTVLDRDRARSAREGAVEASKIELEKARTGVAKQEENLAKLRKDREQFTLTAPEAGYAVYGVLSKGKWQATDVPPQALIAQRRFKVKPNQVLWTIVRPGDVTVRTSVVEASVFSVADGQSAKVKPGPAPKTSLAAKVVRVARTSGGTDYELLLDVEKPDARLLPGHTCKISLTTADKPAALTVPSGAVEADGDKRFLHVLAEGKPARREVEVGDTSGGRTEILSGVAEGDRVLATPPKAK